MKQQIIPNTVIAGFPKSGTSSLWYWLSDHPDVCGSKVKETYYLFDKVVPLNKNANFQEHGWEGYTQQFPHYQGEKIIMEATPVYFNQKTPLEQLPKLDPLPKMIFIVREPSQRIFSFYRFQKYRLKNVGKNTSFEEFINNRPKMLQNNNYIEKLKPWLEKFGKANVHVFLMEEMLNEPQKFMDKVCQYLNIDASFYNAYSFPVGNPTVQIKFKWLHQLGLKIQRYIPNKIQTRVLNPLYLKMNAKALPPPSEPDLETKENLKARCRPYNQELASVFNLSLDYWE